MLFVAAVVGVALAVPRVSSAQAPLAQDSVSFTGGPSQAGSYTVFTVDATSGPSGENPSGQVRFDVFGGAFQVGGPVTCLAVSGNAATINIQNQGSGLGIVTVQVLDSAPDTFDAAPLFRSPTDCSPLPPSSLGGPLSRGDITVVDAPPLPTSKDQCKDGGWQQYAFKNQGECVAFVHRGS